MYESVLWTLSGSVEIRLQEKKKNGNESFGIQKSRLIDELIHRKETEFYITSRDRFHIIFYLADFWPLRSWASILWANRNQVGGTAVSLFGKKLN